MRARLVGRYAIGVVTADSVRWLADAFTPLTSKFGDRLSLFRDGDRVQWTYEGQAAIVELRSEGAIEATFVDRSTVDGVSGTTACAVYRSLGQGYALSAEGCRRIVSDMVDFFSGIREPRFAFVDAHVTPKRH